MLINDDSDYGQTGQIATPCLNEPVFVSARIGARLSPEFLVIELDGCFFNKSGHKFNKSECNEVTC